MNRDRPFLHHVVFCVELTHQEEAVRWWTDLGFDLAVIELADVGLRVLLDWKRGVEIIMPTDTSLPEGARVRRYLDRRGEGVYSVVVLTTDIDGPLSIAGRHGVQPDLLQNRSGEGFHLEEAMMEPFHGMPITFLATDLPE